MPSVGQFLGSMRTYLGVVETPLGSNRSRVGKEFGWDGVPWCAETISVACRKINFDWWTASTDQMEAWARAGRRGSKWIARTGKIQPGDIVVWDYKRDGTANHVSVIESIRADGKLVTLGGNESNRCQRAVRSRSSYIRGFIRLPFTTSTVIKPPTKPPTIVVSHPTLRLGSTGVAVKEFQWKMVAVTGAKIAGDGLYSFADKVATTRFQKFVWPNDPSMHDGVVGPKTWGVLDYFYALKYGK